MNMLLFIWQQPTPPTDPNWERLFSWLLTNWFTTLIIIIGVVIVWLLGRWVVESIRTLGVMSTVFVILFGAVLLLVLLWVISIFIPKAVSFGPQVWNTAMEAAGNQPALLVPGDATPIPSPSPLPDGFLLGRYVIQHESGSATLRDGSSPDANILGEIPNGTEVRVLSTVPSNCVGGVCFRAQIDPVGEFPEGWLHAVTLGTYLGP
jgi:hypothetical protein